MIKSGNIRQMLYKLLLRFGRKKAMTNTQVKPLVPIYDIPMLDIKGNTTTLRAYQGKRILIVNVASECGYTPQYAQLQELHELHSDKIVVLGFPCNQFGSQERGTEEQIVAFCSRAYGIAFPMFSKIEVKGPGQHPLYRWLTDSSMNGWNTQSSEWNFCKYVIGEDGSLLHFLSSSVSPFDQRILS
jgi:glutathione peroxidase